jgi:hypothetical protein
VKDLGKMTERELKEWMREQREASAQMFKDVPPGPISNRKGDDYPHWADDALLAATAADLDGILEFGERTEPILVTGMRAVTDKRAHVIIAVGAAGDALAVRRADGTRWVSLNDFGVGAPGSVRDFTGDVQVWSLSALPEDDRAVTLPDASVSGSASFVVRTGGVT